jgi:dolichyl-phosphate beta-glucosyltransferase
MGRLFNLVVRLFAVRGIRDTQCGFKLFTRDTARAIFTRTRLDRFGFDVEALALARWLGAPIDEVPVRWCNDEDSRVTLLGGAAAFLDPVRVRLLMLMRRYGSRSTADAATMPSGFRRGEAP